MTGFLLGACVLVVVALVFLLPPLLRRPPVVSASQPQLNAAIYRDQLAELEQDRAAGTLSRTDFAAAVADLQCRLLEDSRRTAEHSEKAAPGGRVVPIALGLLLPLGAALLYLALGTPAALNPPAHPQHFTQGGIESMVARLASKLEQEPDNLAGWAILARSYKSLGRFGEAVRAYQHATPLLETRPDLLADYADTLVASAGGFTAQAMTIIDQALRIDPANPQALWLRGTAAFDAGDFAKAAADWEKLLAALEPGSEDAQLVEANIAEARAKGGLDAATREVGADKTATASSRAIIQGRVVLAQRWIGKLPDTATVMIVARPADGSRMPVAVLRAPLRDLPLNFTLDDSLAMAPDHKLSDFAEVIVEPRISLSGLAIPKPGDLYGESRTVKVGTHDLRLEIDQVR